MTKSSKLAFAVWLASLPLFSTPSFPEVRLCPPNLCNGSTVISHPQPPNTKVLEFKVLGNKVLYTSNSSCRRELYTVPAAGGEVRQVSKMTMQDPQDPCFRNVYPNFSFSPDGTTAVYEADGDFIPTHSHGQGDQDIHLYSSVLASLAQTRIVPILPFDYDVENHQTSCDSVRVVFRRGKDSKNSWELWSVPLHGPDVLARRISQQMGDSQAVGAFWLTCDGMAWYMADTAQSGSYDLWKVPINGSAAPVLVDLIFSDGFESGGVTKWH